jgi:hypothetical protein
VSKVPGADIECAIRARPNRDFLQLDAIVRSDTPVTGQYNLTVFKQSPTGTSQNNQSGAFELIIGSEHVLTTIVLDRSAIDHYRAQLSLESNRGSVSCTSP